MPMKPSVNRSLAGFFSWARPGSVNPVRAADASVPFIMSRREMVG